MTTEGAPSQGAGPGGWVTPVVGVLAALGWAAGERTGLAATAAGLCVVVGAWRPAWLAGALLALGATDLVLTVDAGGFTFRVAQLAAVVLAAAAVARVGLPAYLRELVRLPALPALGVLLALIAVRVALGVPFRGKAVGYLAWALFDVVIMAPAVAWHLRRAPARALTWWWWGAAAVALFGLGQLAVGLGGVAPPLVVQWVGARPRINGLSYEPSYFAFQALIPLAAIAGAGAHARLRTLHAVGSVAAVPLAVAVFLSSSRSGWLGLAILALAGLLFLAVRRRRPGGGWLVRSLAGAAAVAVLAWGFVPGHVLAADRILAMKALDLNDPSSSQPRREGVLEAVALFRLRPVLGHGAGQFGAALLDHPELQLRTLRPEERNAHDLVTFNLYAELLSETGAAGTLAFLVALGLLAHALWRSRGGTHRGALAAAMLWPLLLTFVVAFQFNQTLWRTEAWCLWGAAWAFCRRRGH